MSVLEALREENDMLRERIRQLEGVIALSSLTTPIEWGLTNSESRLFMHLLTRPTVTKKSAIMAMYSDRADEAPEEKIVDVFICKMRKKLKPFSIHIDTVWGQGYQLINREEIRERLGVK